MWNLSEIVIATLQGLWKGWGQGFMARTFFKRHGESHFLYTLALRLDREKNCVSSVAPGRADKIATDTSFFISGLRARPACPSLKEGEKIVGRKRGELRVVVEWVKVGAWGMIKNVGKGQGRGRLTVVGIRAGEETKIGWGRERDARGRGRDRSGGRPTPNPILYFIIVHF